MNKAICVYSSSSDAVAEHFFDAAAELGAILADRGYTLVYGGGGIGLMGQVARSVHENGGKVIGVIPEYLNRPDIVYEQADQLIVTKDMRERKAIMEDMSDAFIGLPGGFGTLEEMLEILTLKQVQQHRKAVVFLNTEGFFGNLLSQFEKIFRESFAKAEQRILYAIVPHPEEALQYIDSYEPPKLQKKWF